MRRERINAESYCVDKGKQLALPFHFFQLRKLNNCDMKQQIATNKFQSERLLKCGVPAETSDMCWVGGFLNVMLYSAMLDRCLGDSAIKGEERGAEIIDLTPAWSLSCLLGLFPKEMGIAIGAYPGSDKYTCFTLIDPDVEPIVADTAIEACVRMVEQLTANGYALNGIEKGGEK